MQEFGFGFYDGISGLVTQPLEGAKKEGVAGLIKGFGKGIGGVVLKPGAGKHFHDESFYAPTDFIAIWGLPGYTFKGIYKELQKHLGSSVQNYIVAARTAQGYDEWHSSSQEERLDVVSRWQSIQVEIEREKQLARHGIFHGRYCYLKTTIEERKKSSAEKKKGKKGKKKGKGDATEDAFAEIHASHPFVASTQKSQKSDPNRDDADFEEAIRASVAATSRGNPEEDQMIEKAIRASVMELQLASTEGNNNEAIQRAIQASGAEAAQTRSEIHSKPRPTTLDGAGDREKGLAAALQRSLLENQRSEQRHPVADIDFDDSGVDTDDDENIKAAIDRSKSSPTRQPRDGKNDDDFQTAIELSRKANEEHEQGLSKSKTEEEIVLEYVKKQSLAEEQLKKSVAANKDQ